MNDNDVFYIKTKDGTSFGIYDLSINEDVNKIDFTYSCVDEELSTNTYRDEVYDIVTNIVTDAIKENMGTNT